MRKINNTIFVLFLALFLTACDTKKTATDSQNDISNIIIDNAYVILDNAKLMQQYRDYNKALLERFDIDFRTITTTEDKDIDIFANKEFNKLQQESRSKTGKAILMVINTTQDKVRLEVSMALEPVYTDAFVSHVERKGFVSYFRNDTIAEAIYMATELVMDRANDVKNGKEFMPPMESKSIGAGAKTKSHIGVKDEGAKKGKNVSVSSSDTPKDILVKYLSALKKHNTNPNLDIYSDTTKKFFQKHTVTEINQNHEIQFLEPCMQSKVYRYSFDGNHAVGMNDPVKRRKCTPHFFKKEQGNWTLDIATMAQVLRFNAPMQWHFDLKNRLKGEAKYYAFAFDGFTFDGNGYPNIPNGKRKIPKGVRWGFDSSANWYEPGPSLAEVKKHPKKYVKAMMTYIYNGSCAETRLGAESGDYIRDMEINGKLYKNVLYDDFYRLMGEAKKGSVVKLFVKSYGGEFVTREGIAP